MRIIVLILAMFLVGCKKEEIKEPELPRKCFDFEVLEGVAVIQYEHGSMTVPVGRKPVLGGVDSITVFCLEPCRYRVGADTYSSREEFEVCDGGIE